MVNSCSDRVPGVLHACVCDFDACNLSKWVSYSITECDLFWYLRIIAVFIKFYNLHRLSLVLMSPFEANLPHVIMMWRNTIDHLLIIGQHIYDGDNSNFQGQFVEEFIYGKDEQHWWIFLTCLFNVLPLHALFNAVVWKVNKVDSRKLLSLGEIPWQPAFVVVLRETDHYRAIYYWTVSIEFETRKHVWSQTLLIQSNNILLGIIHEGDIWGKLKI